jgi:hypothetical protein
MFVLLILLLLTNPVKGPSGNSSIALNRGSASEHPQADQKKDSATSYINNQLILLARIQTSREQQTATADSTRVAEAKENDSKTLLLLGLTVAGTWTLAIIGFVQYRNSRDSKRRELRAYLAVEPQPIWPNMEGAIEPLAIISIKNYGQTPAHDVSIWTNRMFAPSENVTFTPDKEPPRNVGTIHPFRDSAQQGFYFPDRRPAPSSQELDAFSKNEVSIFYFGEVTYLDTFKRKRVTRFRFIYHPELHLELPGEALWRYPPSLTEDGNIAD